MKRQISPAALSPKKKRINFISASGVQLMAHKVAAKKVSASSRIQACQGKSQFAFVPADADIKVIRWPKL